MSELPRPDLQEIKRTYDLFVAPGAVTELRAVDYVERPARGKKQWPGTLSGYYNDRDAFAKEIEQATIGAGGAYIMPNPVIPALLARRENRAQIVGEGDLTTNEQILRRHWLSFDFDPVRPTKISATDAEKAQAQAQADAVEAWLTAQFGFPEPVRADGGNSPHILYRVDLPNDAASGDLIKTCMQAVDCCFSDDAVSVDTGNHNAGRVWKCYGTLARKGDHTADRPHRLSRLLSVPESIQIVSPETLKALAATLPQPEQATPNASGGAHRQRSDGTFDVEDFMARYGIETRYKGKWNQAEKWLLVACPFNSEHTDKSAVIVRFPDGHLGFRCHHNSCQGRGWTDVRDLFEPDRPRGSANRDRKTACQDIPRGDASEGEPSTPRAQWEAPLPLPALLPDVPQMTADMLPHGLRPWLTDIAKRVQCPLDYLGVSACVAAATVIGRKVGLFPKKRDDWLVIPNLWAMIIGRPGVLKTPAMVEAMRPLDRLVAQAQSDYADARKEYLLAAATHEIKLKATKAELGKAARKGDNAMMERQVLNLSALQEGAPEEPVERRYKTNDTTVEKLQLLLANNPNGVVLYRDELTGWLYSLEKSGREGDREFYLECWNGDGKFTLDRIGRGTIHSNGLCLSVLGSIQPGKLQEYVGGAIGGGISDDGLLQRLQLAVWPDVAPAWNNVDEWPDTDAKARAWMIFERLASLGPEHIPEPEQQAFDKGLPPAVRFDSDAQPVFDAWRGALELRLRSGEMHPAMESHLAKYRSLMPSLALIFHLTFHAHQAREKDLAPGCVTPVSEHAARLAIRWCDYLEAHARRVYGADVDKDKHRAHALAKHILSGDVTDEDTIRIVHRHHWLMLNNSEDVYAALSVLERLHWVRIETQQTGGRSREVIRINPAITDEKFPPFSQVTGDKSDKSQPQGQSSDPSGTFVTCHLENSAEKNNQHVQREEEENSENALLVTGDKSDKSPRGDPAPTGDDLPPWWDGSGHDTDSDEWRF